MLRECWQAQCRIESDLQFVEKRWSNENHNGEGDDATCDD